MVRRRTAAPRPSMPVRSAAPSSNRGYQQQMPPPPPPGQQSRGPGLMGQMAATAGGVAIGSAVGHSIGHMMTGGGRNEDAQQQHAAVTQEQQYQNPCEFEWKKFLECTQNQQDLSMCQAFNDAFKRCQSGQ
ncbi:unnamed protein product, partial [Mesorhabditis spiculigera]